MSGERGAGHDSPMPDDGLGVPSSGEMAGREAHTTDYPAPDAWPAAPGGRATTPGPATAPEPAAGTGGAAGRAAWARAGRRPCGCARGRTRWFRCRLLRRCR